MLAFDRQILGFAGGRHFPLSFAGVVRAVSARIAGPVVRGTEGLLPGSGKWMENVFTKSLSFTGSALKHFPPEKKSALGKTRKTLGFSTRFLAAYVPPAENEVREPRFSRGFLKSPLLGSSTSGKCDSQIAHFSRYFQIKMPVAACGKWAEKPLSPTCQSAIFLSDFKVGRRKHFPLVDFHVRKPRFR